MPAAAQVQAIIGLDNLHKRQPLLTRTPPSTRTRAAAGSGAATRVGRAAQVATGGPQPCRAAVSAGGAAGSYTADQFASMYDFSTPYRAGNFGAGQTIAFYELEPYSASDIATYQSCYRTSARITNVLVDGGAGIGDGSGEAALDLEVFLGLAPKANIFVYEGPNSGVGVYDTYKAIMNQNIASVVSVSWGLCEQYAGRAAMIAESYLFQQAAAQGQSVLAASGDSGAQGCSLSVSSNTDLSVDDPAGQPYVTGVGGTSVFDPGSPPGEVVWNSAADGRGASGGGRSQLFAAPGYQRTYVGATTSREVPDVSADADPETGHVFFHAGRWGTIGGTSAGVPLWAAVLALTNAGCANRIGFVNPALYYAFSDHDPVHVGNDIVTHREYPGNVNNDYTGTGGGQFPVRVGYDLATGLGSPKTGPLSAELCRNSPPPSQMSARLVGDFNGDGRADIAVYRPSTGMWLVRSGLSLQWGRPGDVPLVADFNGDGRTDIAVYRPSTGMWLVRGAAGVQWGRPGDLPVAADFSGDGRTDFTVFRPSTGAWLVRGTPGLVFGGPGDVPLAGNYTGDRRADIAIYRPATGVWLVRGRPAQQWGRPGDLPLVGDFSGDGRADVAVYRPSTRTWLRPPSGSLQWGRTGDLPV